MNWCPLHKTQTAVFFRNGFYFLTLVILKNSGWENITQNFLRLLKVLCHFYVEVHFGDFELWNIIQFSQNDNKMLKERAFINILSIEVPVM